MKDPCKYCKDVHEGCKLNCFARDIFQIIKKRKMQPGETEKAERREYESFVSDTWRRRRYRPQY